ncbi:hypothetical protein ACIQTN_32330 [Streptomyces werraensis]|uniref:hypothetical protein n=1 Tax=Streptomyces werraensis TaxID=68284 RepID=UPI00382F8FF4
MPDHEPVPHPGEDDIASRAWAEALEMAHGDPDRAPGELVAAALEAHRELSRALGRTVPVTALGPDGGVRGLAAFVAVYAARRDRRTGRAPDSDQSGERVDDVVEFAAVHGERLGRDRRRVEHREHGTQAVDTGVPGHPESECRGVAPRVAQTRP